MKCKNTSCHLILWLAACWYHHQMKFLRSHQLTVNKYHPCSDKKCSRVYVNRQGEFPLHHEWGNKYKYGDGVFCPRKWRWHKFITSLDSAADGGSHPLFPMCHPIRALDGLFILRRVSSHFILRFDLLSPGIPRSRHRERRPSNPFYINERTNIKHMDAVLETPWASKKAKGKFWSQATQYLKKKSNLNSILYMINTGGERLNFQNRQNPRKKYL